MALLDKRLDHAIMGPISLVAAGAHIGIEHVGGAHDADKLVGELRRDLGGRTALLVGALDNLVVDIGEVLGERDLVAARDEPAANHIEADERAGVADVNVVVDRGAAHVHADLAGLDGLELFLFMGSAVVDTHSLLLNSFL